MREYLELSAEFQEALKIHQTLPIGIVTIIRHNGLVNTAQDIDYFLVFEYLHKLHDLALIICSFVGLAYFLVKG